MLVFDPRCHAGSPEPATVFTHQPAFVAGAAQLRGREQLAVGNIGPPLLRGEQGRHRQADEFTLLVAHQPADALVPGQRSPVAADQEDGVVANLLDQRAEPLVPDAVDSAPSLGESLLHDARWDVPRWGVVARVTSFWLLAIGYWLLAIVCADAQLKCVMRIATWNVNSLKARLEKVSWWLERTRPDVLLMQETKLADSAAPAAEFRAAGYELAHHGEGQWNGVAIASRVGIADVVTNFGEPLRPARTPDVGDDEPLAEARMMAATCGGVRVVALYAPNGRSVDSIFYEAKLAWYERLAQWLERAADPNEPIVLGGDFNLAPEDKDVWDPRACHGGTHVSPREREAFFRLCRWGLVDAYRLHHPETGRYTWWDYRAGNFHKNFGMRIDHLLVTRPVAERTVGAEIDREARKGKPIPSDHAPLVIDLDHPGHPFDAGWVSAEARIAARSGNG